MQWFVDAVMARYNEIVRDLERGKPKPIFDVDERNGDVLWELWLDGFAEAMELRPESWAFVEQGEDEEAAEALAGLTMFVAVARNESDLDSREINALQDEAPATIMANVSRLHAARLRTGVVPEGQPSGRASKIGRNDPCRCGSGKKLKRCCG